MPWRCWRWPCRQGHAPGPIGVRAWKTTAKPKPCAWIPSCWCFAIAVCREPHPSATASTSTRPADAVVGGSLGLNQPPPPIARHCQGPAAPTGTPVTWGGETGAMSTSRALAGVEPSLRHEWLMPVDSTTATPGRSPGSVNLGPRHSAIGPSGMQANPGTGYGRCS